MMNDDINEQYEKIFGKEQRPNIFSDEDEGYTQLRQEIIKAPREYNPKKVYPFANIKIMDYDDYQREEIVRKMEKKGYHIFYIRRFEGGKMSVYAAGFLNAFNSKFVVFSKSFGKNTEYGRYLLRKLARKVFALDSIVKIDKGSLIHCSDVPYDSASLAASVLLGWKSTFREWRDKRGKSLNAYYAKYRSNTIDEKEEETFPNHIVHI